MAERLNQPWVDGQSDRPTPTALLCFSHLRWGFVWQRPQHLLARFARDLDVYVVEEPEFSEASQKPELRIESRDGLTIITPLMPASNTPRWGFNDFTNPVIANLLAPYLRQRGVTGSGSSPIVWYYTPMALGACPESVTPAAVVYDVMDELANFLGAPATLQSKEAALVDLADVMFTGGPSLYQARLGRHPHLSCFPSGVEADHFAGADIAPDLTEVSQPLIGFYGVIDERMDLDLVAGIADLRPDWTVLMIGPVVKIDPGALPLRPNISYPGKRSYAELPAYLAGFDAAILPFALNNATRFISPTKTLEYLAAGKPVVSTPIRDVVDLYGTVVEIASTPLEFVQAIERLWSESPAQRAVRQAASDQIVAEHSWDAIASAMRTEIDAALERRAGDAHTNIQISIPIRPLLTAENRAVTTTAD